MQKDKKETGATLPDYPEKLQAFMQTVNHVHAIG